MHGQRPDRLLGRTDVRLGGHQRSRLTHGPSRIHPTAIIEPGAELADDVTIGAYAYVGARAVLGAGTVLHHHANVEGRTTIGRQCEIFPFACVGTKTHDLKFKGGDPGLMIATATCFANTSACTARPTTANTRGSATTTCCSPTATWRTTAWVGNFLVMSAQSALAGHVIVEDHVNIGWGTGVHQFCRIGSYAMLGGMSKLVQDAPPYIIADGNPAIARSINKVGLERSGFSVAQLEAVKQIFRLVYRAGHNRTRRWRNCASTLSLRRRSSSTSSPSPTAASAASSPANRPGAVMPLAAVSGA